MRGRDEAALRAGALGTAAARADDARLAGRPRRFGRRAALAAAGSALAATTLRVAPARAASDEGGLLLGLWRRETGLAFAYGAALHADPIFALLRAHAADHAAAIATELAAVGLGTPKEPKEHADLDIAAERLATSSTLANAVLVEEDMVAVYKTALPALPDAKIAMTAATILAAHAQQLFILRRAVEG